MRKLLCHLKAVNTWVLLTREVEKGGGGGGGGTAEETDFPQLEKSTLINGQTC